MQASRSLKLSDDNEETPTEAPDCRCGGTGVYTVEVSLADAVVLIHRVCLNHVVHRARVKDRTTGRIGEVMETSIARNLAWLRPPGGGREWESRGENLEPADAQ